MASKLVQKNDLHCQYFFENPNLLLKQSKPSSLLWTWVNTFFITIKDVARRGKDLPLWFKSPRQVFRAYLWVQSYLSKNNPDQILLVISSLLICDRARKWVQACYLEPFCECSTRSIATLALLGHLLMERAQNIGEISITQTDGETKAMKSSWPGQSQYEWSIEEQSAESLHCGALC